MRNSHIVAIATFLGMSVSPAAVLAQQTPATQAPAAQANTCAELVRFLEQRGTATPASPMTLDQARTYQRANNNTACRDGLVRIQGAGITLPAALITLTQGTGTATGSEAIVVQQPAAQLRVEQAPPQVTVQQPQPQVTVNPGQPEILVRQPAPTVTIDIPRPEITVRMPQPDVNVAMAQPQVQVTQPRPQVQVVQPEAQPQVQVNPGQAQVTVQQPTTAPGVAIQNAQQPQVRYERAEPRVVINQAEGAPQVRVEQMGQTAQAATGMQGGAGDQRSFTAADLSAMSVYNAAGNEIGDVENVLVGPNNQMQLVVAYGGFLGIGERRVTIPMEQVRMQGDRLVITGRTDDQLRALPAFTQAPTGYRQATGTMAVPVLVTSAAVGGAAVGAPAATGTAATGTAAAGAATAGRANTRAMAASQLVDMDVYNLRGEQLGDVKRVMMGSGNQLYIIIGHGGFLGLGEKEILLPMERVQLRDDRLVVQGIDDDSIRRMPAFNAGTAGGYREVERTFNTSVPLYAN